MKSLSRKGAKAQRKYGDRTDFAPPRLCATFLIIIALLVSTTTAFSQTRTNNYLFNDSHFHLTNYIQEGIDIHDFLQPVRTFLEASDSGSERESAQQKLRADLR